MQSPLTLGNRLLPQLSSSVELGTALIAEEKNQLQARRPTFPLRSLPQSTQPASRRIRLLTTGSGPSAPKPRPTFPQQRGKVGKRRRPAASADPSAVTRHIRWRALRAPCGVLSGHSWPPSRAACEPEHRTCGDHARSAPARATRLDAECERRAAAAQQRGAQSLTDLIAMRGPHAAPAQQSKTSPDSPALVQFCIFSVQVSSDSFIFYALNTTHTLFSTQ